MSAQVKFVSSAATCSVVESVPLVSLIVSSADCSSDIICHLLSNSSSQLQVVCSAASCSFSVIRDISYNFLCSSARTNNAMVCTRHALCPEPVQLSDVHNNKASTIELDHLMVKYAADSFLHLTRDTNPVTDVDWNQVQR